MDDLYFNRNTHAELALAKAWGGNPSLLVITAATRMQTCMFASLDTEREKVYG
jgi:hypothetical protein